MSKIGLEDYADTYGDGKKMKWSKEDGKPTTPVISRKTTLLDSKIAERLRNWIAPGKCDRHGDCCVRIPIPLSPRQLRQSYENWLHYQLNKQNDSKLEMSVSDNVLEKTTQRVHQDIYLIYPMLVGRCLGKTKQISKDFNRTIEYLYIYGPCKNYATDSSGLPTCSINDHKPWMCSSYPNGGRGTFKGCGFNPDPEFGTTIANLSKGKLETLDDDDL